MKKTFYSSVFLLLFLMPFAAGEAFSASTSSLSTEPSFILPQYSKRISLDFKNADIKDVLKVFSQQIGSNFIVSDKVRDKQITVFLDKVPVEDAFAKLLEANGMVYRFDQASNIFMVDLKDETEKLATRVYPLKYATVPSAKILSTFTISENDDAESSTSSTTSTTTTGGILDAIAPVLSKSGKIAVDDRTNSLIITDADENFPFIEDVISRLDVPVPQVLIQVEMIDTAKGTLDEIGVKFGDTLFRATGLASKNFAFPFKTASVKGAGGETSYSYGEFDGQEFDAALQLLGSKTDTKSLARPRILTMDNQTAQIKISSNEVVGIDRTTSTSGGPDTETAERMETGVILTVTPQVNLLTGDIMMAVSPKVIDVKQSPLGEFMDPETRGAKVMMRVHDGATIVLGGLLRSNNTKTITKVPLLGDIPFVGRLFRHRYEKNDDRELLIFITPHILSGEGVFSGVSKSGVDVTSRESSSSLRFQEMESDIDRARTHRNLR